MFAVRTLTRCRLNVCRVVRNRWVLSNVRTRDLRLFSSGTTANGADSSALSAALESLSLDAEALNELVDTYATQTDASTQNNAAQQGMVDTTKLVLEACGGDARGRVFTTGIGRHMMMWRSS